MSQNTIQQAINDIAILSKTPAAEAPLAKLLRPWLAITDLELEDALTRNATELWDQLARVHKGLSGYLAVMGSTPDPDELQEAACRLMGSFEIMGTNIIEGDIDITQKMSIVFEGGSWIYITDPKLRLRQTSDKFRTALKAVRQMLKSE
jgi:hypothetical protein